MDREAEIKHWITSNGGFVHPDLVVLDESSRPYRSVTAKNSLEKGTELMRIPISLCVHTSRASLTQGPQVRSPGGKSSDLDILETLPQLSPFLALTLHLMHEMAQGDQTTLAPYIASLPASHDAILGWEDTDKAALQGTSLECKMGESYLNFYESEVAPIISSHPELWPGDWGSYATFQRVAGLVQSRTFHLQEDNWLTGTSSSGSDLWLIPAIDQVNHSTDPALRNTSLHRRDANAPSTSQQGSNGEDSCFTMEAERDIAAGEEVLHTYGDLSDAQLLDIYGFIDTLESGFDNPHNEVLMSSGYLLSIIQAGQGRKASKALKWRKSSLKRYNMLPDTFSIGREDLLPDSLVAATQALLMDDEDFKDVEELLKSERADRADEDGSNAQATFMSVLGTDSVMEGDEQSMLVCTTLLRTYDAVLKSFPYQPRQADANMPTSLRKRQAMHILAKEKEIMQLAKEELIKLMMTVAAESDSE